MIAFLDWFVCVLGFVIVVLFLLYFEFWFYFFAFDVCVYC